MDERNAGPLDDRLLGVHAPGSNAAEEHDHDHGGGADEAVPVQETHEGAPGHVGFDSEMAKQGARDDLHCDQREQDDTQCPVGLHGGFGRRFPVGQPCTRRHDRDGDERREDEVGEDPVHDREHQALFGDARSSEYSLRDDGEKHTSGQAVQPSPAIDSPEVNQQHDRREPDQQPPEAVGMLDKRGNVALHKRDGKENEQMSLRNQPALDGETCLETRHHAAGDDHEQRHQRRHHREACCPVDPRRGVGREAPAEDGADRAQRHRRDQESENPASRRPEPVLRSVSTEKAQEDQEVDGRDRHADHGARSDRAGGESPANVAGGKQAGGAPDGRQPRGQEPWGWGHGGEVEHDPHRDRRTEDDREQRSAWRPAGLGVHRGLLGPVAAGWTAAGPSLTM